MRCFLLVKNFMEVGLILLEDICVLLWKIVIIVGNILSSFLDKDSSNIIMVILLMVYFLGAVEIEAYGLPLNWMMLYRTSMLFVENYVLI